MACLPCKARAEARRAAAAATPSASRTFTVETSGETRTFSSPIQAARYAKANGGSVTAD